METLPARPAIFDLDIGNDPDDTVAALLIARAPERFRLPRRPQYDVRRDPAAFFRVVPSFASR